MRQKHQTNIFPLVNQKKDMALVASLSETHVGVMQAVRVVQARIKRPSMSQDVMLGNNANTKKKDFDLK